MSKNFFSIKLSEIADVIAGQSPESLYYSNTIGTPFLQGNRTFRNLYPIIDTYTTKVTKLARKGDVLMSVRAPVGDLNYAPCDLCIGRGLASIKAKNGNNNFIFYALKHNINTLLRQGNGTTYDSVNKDVINDFELIIPESIQDRENVSLFLTSLDSKIELNNRINAELEAMAKTIYDYWFVQFDFPDKNGKPYKSSGGKMVWNEELKREIPEGWEVMSIEKCCAIIDCLHSKKSDLVFENEQSYLLQLDNILDNGLIDLTNKYYVSKAEYKKWTSRIEVEDGDIVITNAGRVAATAQIPKEIKAGIGRNITAIRPITICPTYLYLSFQSADIKRQIKLNTDSGAFFTSFNVKGIKRLFLLRPAKQIEEKFEEIALPIRRQRELNNNAIKKLTELRDWLLPMLMNGQVKVG